MTPLKKLEAELRSAVESRQYSEVERLLVEYCRAAGMYVSSLAPDGPELPEAQTAVEGVLQWTGRMLQAGRESLVLDLGRLPRVERYLHAPPPGGTNWHVEG